MTTVYVLFEEYELKGVYSSLDKALSQREKLNDRGLIEHCRLDEFVPHALSLDSHLLYPGEEPKFKSWKL